MEEEFVLHQELLNLHDVNYSIPNEVLVTELRKEELDEMLNGNLFLILSVNNYNFELFYVNIVKIYSYRR
jgi:hypothetical protein